DVSDVRDVVRAYRALMEKGTPGEVYNVCSGTGISIGALANLMLQRSATSLTLQPAEEHVRAIDVPYLVGDNTKLRTATGWTPQFPLEEPLDTVLAHARTAALQGS